MHGDMTGYLHTVTKIKYLMTYAEMFFLLYFNYCFNFFFTVSHGYLGIIFFIVCVTLYKNSNNSCEITNNG